MEPELAEFESLVRAFVDEKVEWPAVNEKALELLGVQFPPELADLEELQLIFATSLEEEDATASRSVIEALLEKHDRARAARS